MSKKSLAAFLLLISMALCVTGQTPAPADEKTKSEKEQEKRKELERKTLALLDEVVSGVWGLKLSENRSFVLAAAGNLLWPHDEKRARNLLWDALNNLNLPTAATESAGKNSGKESKDPAVKEPTNKSGAKSPGPKAPTKEQLQEVDRYLEIFRERSEFLRKVAARDSQLALDMLRATRQVPPQVPGDFYAHGESDLEEEIAGVVAAHDPKQALQIARQSLAKGLSFEQLNLLSRLNQQDQAAASEFSGDIIAKLDQENLETNPEALLVATVLLSRSRTPEVVVTTEDVSQMYLPKSLKLSDEQKRGLVQMITDAALSPTAPVNILQNTSFVMADIEKFAPDRAAKVKAKLAESNRTYNRNQAQLNSVYENASPEQMIREADKLGDDQREQLYRNAVITATTRGRADALREFINSQVADEERKQNLLDLLDTQQLDAAVSRGKTEDLQKLLPLIRLKEQRALAMAELAILLEKQGKHDDALSLLEEARGLVKVDFTSDKRSNVLLTLMLAYALIQPDKAFQITEPIIDRANTDISKLLLLDRVAKTGATRNGEIILSQPRIPLDYTMLRFSPGIVALAKADFDHTKSLADRFERPELRLLARLLVAQALLLHGEQSTPDK